MPNNTAPLHDWKAASDAIPSKSQAIDFACDFDNSRGR